jgi:hypothetical protein
MSLTHEELTAAQERMAKSVARMREKARSSPGGVAAEYVGLVQTAGEMLHTAHCCTERGEWYEVAATQEALDEAVARWRAGPPPEVAPYEEVPNYVKGEKVYLAASK